MNGTVGALVEEVRAAVSRLDPDAVPLPDVTAEWSRWAELERLAAAAKTLLARRVEAASDWKVAGFRSAPEALAAVAGTSITAARTTLETSERLAALPATAAAVRAGALSPAKADAVAAAAVVAPDAEAALLATAARATLAETRSACVRAKVAADGEAMHARIVRQRRLVSHRDDEGAFVLHARGPLERGQEVIATIDEIVDQLFDAARRRGEREDRAAYAFDALVELARRARDAAGGGSGAGDGRAGARQPRSGRKWLGLLRVDVAALARDRAEGDEVCEIAGVGPVATSVARSLLGEAVLKLVLTTGREVRNITYLGRGPNAVQRAALMWEQPLCSVEGCPSLRLQFDHRIDYARTRHTKVEETDRLCQQHHRRKTVAGWALVAGTGRRAMVPPEDPRHPRYQPPPASPP